MLIPIPIVATALPSNVTGPGRRKDNMFEVAKCFPFVVLNKG